MLYSAVENALAEFVAQTGISVVVTQARKGSLPFDHPQCLGVMEVTGTPRANNLAEDADLIIGVGTRYTDFTPASKTAFQDPEVKFININVAEFDAGPHCQVLGDARRKHLNFEQAVGAGVFSSIGEGCIDFEGFHRLLTQTDYSGWMLVEHGVIYGKFKIPPVESMRSSLNYLKGVASHLQASRSVAQKQ